MAPENLGNMEQFRRKQIDQQPPGFVQNQAFLLMGKGFKSQVKIFAPGLDQQRWLAFDNIEVPFRVVKAKQLGMAAGCQQGIEAFQGINAAAVVVMAVTAISAYVPADLQIRLTQVGQCVNIFHQAF